MSVRRFRTRHAPNNQRDSRGKQREHVDPGVDSRLYRYAMQTKKRAGYRIGELGALTGASVDTVRYYERVGLLAQPERTAAGYRIYGEADRGRLRFIRRAKLLGLTLEEIRSLIETAGNGDCGPLRNEVLALLDEKIAECEHQLIEVKALRQDLVAQHRRVAGAGCDCSAFPETCACLPSGAVEHSGKGGELHGRGH